MSESVGCLGILCIGVGVIAILGSIVILTGPLNVYQSNNDRGIGGLGVGFIFIIVGVGLIKGAMSMKEKYSKTTYNGPVIIAGRDVNHSGNVTTYNDLSEVGKLFNTLSAQLNAVKTSTLEDYEKVEAAKEASNALKEEIAKAHRDPAYKPNSKTMGNIVNAFKNLGIPIAETAFTIIGHPEVSEVIRQFANWLK